MKRKIKFRWWALRRAWLTRRYGRPVGGFGCGGMLPQLGDGRFVSVRQRGPFLEMEEKKTGDVIRLVPYQPNHGVMVEMWRDGRLTWRVHCGLDDFRRMGFDKGERTP